MYLHMCDSTYSWMYFNGCVRLAIQARIYYMVYRYSKIIDFFVIRYIGAESIRLACALSTIYLALSLSLSLCHSLIC